MPDWNVKLFKGDSKVVVVSVFYVLSYYFREASVCRLHRSFGRVHPSRRIACGMPFGLPRTVWNRSHAQNLTAFLRSCNLQCIGSFILTTLPLCQKNYMAWNDWVLVNTELERTKLGRWHCGRKGSWGRLRTWCWGEDLDLGQTR